MPKISGSRVTLTCDACKDIALKGGAIPLPESLDKPRIRAPSGWGITIRGGKDNERRGTYYLIGKSKVAKDLLREGKVRRFVALGFSASEASAIFDSLRIRYMFEENVLAEALRTYRADAWRVFPSMGNGINGWKTRNKIGVELSCPRMETVAAVVKVLRLVNNVD